MLPENFRESHKSLISSPIKSGCFFTIVVPVCNEAEHLAKTLKSLTYQFDLYNNPINVEQVEIIFLVNNSTDDSAKIIRRFRNEKSLDFIHCAEINNLPPEQSNVGYVRRWLMNEAYLRLCRNKFGGGIIATTDGDTVVAPNWIAATIAEVEKGADAVGGRILINFTDLRKMNAKTRAFHLRDTGYRLMLAEFEAHLDFVEHDAMPRHHQHFNGSFAVTTDAFEKAGGVPEVSFLEDVAFYHALLRTDARVRHSPFVRVRTSARPDGRTEIGLSSQINEWTIMGENGDDFLVECARTVKRRFQTRKYLRDLQQDISDSGSISPDKIGLLADKLLISGDFLECELNKNQTFGSLYENILREQNNVGEWIKENPLVTIEKAVYDLRLMLEQIRRENKFFCNHNFSQTSNRYFS